MNCGQFADVLRIRGLSAVSHSLVGKKSVAEASAGALQYAMTGALPFRVTGTFVNTWLRNLEFQSLPADMIKCYRKAGGAYRNLEGAESIWRTIPKQIRMGGPDALRKFHSGKDWSHIIPRSAGGSDLAKNGIFEEAARNRARGAIRMNAADIYLARQVLNMGALRQAIEQTVRVSAKSAIHSVAIEAVFSILEYGLLYHEGKITRKELHLEVGKRLMKAAPAAVVAPGIIAGLVMVFPVFLPVLSTLALPATAASYLLMGMRFYQLIGELPPGLWGRLGIRHKTFPVMFGIRHKRFPAGLGIRRKVLQGVS